MCSSLKAVISVKTDLSLVDSSGTMNTLVIFFIDTKYEPLPLITLSKPPISTVLSPATVGTFLMLVKKVFV